MKRALIDGGRTWERVQHSYHSRNQMTRFLMNLCLHSPVYNEQIRTILLRAAETTYRRHQERIAFSALSAIYNLRYLEGAIDAIGSVAAMRNILFTPLNQSVPFSVTSFSTEAGS